MKRTYLLVALIACGCLASVAQTPNPARAQRPKYKEGELLVRFRAGAPMSAQRAAHDRVKAQVTRAYRLVPDLQLVRLPKGTNVLRAARAYRRDASVLYAEPNYRRGLVATPNDPNFGTQWDMHNTGLNGGVADADIDAPEAWNITTGSSSVVVGVIDTGVDYNHQDLAANMVHLESNCTDGIDNDGNGHVDDCYGIDTFSGDNDPLDDHSHGTHVSGTIGARGNNGIGVAGVNWNVGLLACKFIGADGFGYDSGAIACLDYFKDLKDNHGVNLVATNNSWGGDPYDQALFDAIEANMQSGILFIAAAGNAASNNDGGGHYPADYYLPNVIAVAATTRTDGLAGFSNFGKYSVHLGAPGADILSTTPGNTYQTFSGTSMAAPHVAGVVALLKAQDGARDWRALKNLVLAGGDNNSALALTITGKRLNANGSLTCSNSVVLARLRPTGPAVFGSAGVPVALAVEHIDCAAPNGDVAVTVDPGGVAITLHDDGVAPDQAAGDGIYSGEFTPPAMGDYTISFAGETLALHVVKPYFFAPVANDYRAISGTQLAIGDPAFGGDEAFAQVTPSFPIKFGDGSFDKFWVADNGTISFEGGFTSYFNRPLPTEAAQTIVAPFWTDLFLYGSQGIYWAETGSAPNRELVVEWRDVIQYWSCDTSESVRFQVVFFEGSSDILFNYDDAEFGGCADFADFGNVGTVGVQVAPTSGNQFSFDSPNLANNVALLWTTTGPDQPAGAPSITSLSPGSTSSAADFTLTVNGAGFAPISVVRWNGSDRPTTYLAGSQLTAQIAGADLVGGNAAVTVFTFTGGASNVVLFTVSGPTVSSVSPPSLTGGGPGDVTIILTGSDFPADASVFLVPSGGSSSARPTTYNSNTQLSATILASDLGAPNLYSLVVQSPGGIPSPAASFAIADYQPAFYPGPPNLSLARGQSATADLIVIPNFAAFDNPISLTCNLPSTVGSCSVNPASVTPGSSNGQVVVTVHAIAASATAAPPRLGALPWFTAVGLLLPLITLGRRGRKRGVSGLLLVLVLSWAALQLGCGGGGSTPRKTVSNQPVSGTLTVTATSGTLQRTATGTVTVH